jgi:PAS domain S-box-containing protein
MTPGLPVAALLVVFGAVAVAQPSLVFNPAWLLTPLNFVFSTVVPLVAAMIAVVAYRRTGVGAILALGAGMLATSLGSGVLAAVLLYGQGVNASLTVHNMAMLLAAACHFLAAVGGVLGITLGQRRVLHVTLAYAAVVLLIGILLAGALAGSLPAFWTAEAGGTELRATVLRSAAFLYALCALTWWQVSVRDHAIRFLRWYVPGLVLSVVSIAAILLLTTLGDAVNWIGRTAQYLAALYMLVAVAQEAPFGRRGWSGMLGVAILQAGLPFRPLVESASDAVVAIGRDGRIVFWNEIAEQMFGHRAEEVLGADPVPLLGASDTDRATLAGLLSARHSQDRQRRSVELAGHDGRRVPAEVTLFAGEDNPRLVVWVIADVSERLRWQAELEERVRERTAELLELNEELTRANAAKDEFLGLVSHELKTPITSILATAHLLTRRLDSEDSRYRELHDLMPDLATEATRLAGIVDNLLALARLEAGRVVDTEPVLLGRAVKRVTQRIELEWSGRVHLDTSRPDVVVEGNPEQVEMIIHNLVSNALKYSPTTEDVEVRVRADGRLGIVEVLDRGPGIPRRERKRIFEPFYRSPSSQHMQGIGIGLTVCRRLVDGMAGRLTLESGPDGIGTIATVGLPLGQDDDVECPPATAAAARD